MNAKRRAERNSIRTSTFRVELSRMPLVMLQRARPNDRCDKSVTSVTKRRVYDVRRLAL